MGTNIIVEDHRDDRPYYAEMMDALRTWCQPRGYKATIHGTGYGDWFVTVYGKRPGLWFRPKVARFHWPVAVRDISSVYIYNGLSIEEGQAIAVIAGIRKVEVY